MATRRLEIFIKRFESNSKTRNNPGERRELIAAGLAYHPAGDRPGVTVLTDAGREIQKAQRLAQALCSVCGEEPAFGDTKVCRWASCEQAGK